MLFRIKRTAFLSCALLTFAIPFSGIAKDLFLFGSQLQLCSSDLPENCIAAQFPSNAKTQANYELSTAAISTFKRSLAFQHLPETTQHTLAQLLESAVERFESDASNRLTTQQFITRLLDTLPNEQRLALSQYLDKTPHEKIVASLSLTENIYSSLLLDRFTMSVRQLSQAPTPKIGIISLGSDTPYLNTHRFKQIFTQSGFEPIWLPFSSHLAQSINSKHCDQIDDQRQQHHLFDINRHFSQSAIEEHKFCEAPQLFNQTINQLDGLIFLEGEQSQIARLLANPHSPFYSAFGEMKERYNQQKLVVAAEGTSVIAMVGGDQNAIPVPMIRGGNDLSGFKYGPIPTLDEQTSSKERVAYRVNGGLGLVDLGPIDVYFSQNEHLGRLALTSAITRQQYAMGIDSDTGLIISSDTDKRIQILGKAGIYFLNFNESITQLKNAFSQVVFQLNYLLHGDLATWSNSEKRWRFKFNSNRLKTQQIIPWRGYLRHRLNLSCNKTKPTTFSYGGLNYLFAPDQHTQFNSKNESSLCSYLDLKIGIENEQY